MANDLLYATSLDGRLYAIDPSTGAGVAPYPYDSSEIDGQSDALRASPVRLGDAILVASENGRIIRVQEGTRQWFWPSGTPEAGILTTPVVSEDQIYVVLMNGQVQALAGDSGAPGWFFSPPEQQ